jgi:hypothetical protein
MNVVKGGNRERGTGKRMSSAIVACVASVDLLAQRSASRDESFRFPVPRSPFPLLP